MTRVYGDEPRGAWISENQVYRYALWRRWTAPLFSVGPGLQLQDDHKHDVRLSGAPPLVVDMLNPSIADGLRDDQTISRLMNYAEALGCGGLIVVNLFALRATDPRELDAQFMAGNNITGPENLTAVSLAYHQAKQLGYVLAAWGATPSPQKRDRIEEHLTIAKNNGLEYRTLLASPTGDPCHPLVRRKVHATPQPWSPK